MKKHLFKTRKFILLGTLILQGFTQTISSAIIIDQSKIEEEHKQDIALINSYLYTTRQVKTSFNQISNQTKTRGNIHIDKNKKLFAMEYETGYTNLKIISKGKKLFHIDKELDEVTVIPTGNGVARALIAEQINSGEFTIHEIINNQKEIYTKLSLKSQPEEGIFTIEFKILPQNKLEMRAIVIQKQSNTDANVRIDFFNTEINTKINPRVFAIKES